MLAKNVNFCHLCLENGIRGTQKDMSCFLRKVMGRVTWLWLRTAKGPA